jgi:anti-sigma-K factor RskA
MTQMIGKVKVLSDTQLRLTSNTTLQGAAQAKGTATDCMLTILAGQDGANAVAGTVTVTIQGANATTFAAPTTITPDKGTVANLTVAGQQVVHLAQLQYAFYRVALSAAASTTCDTSAIWAFMPTEDSFDATVQ